MSASIQLETDTIVAIATPPGRGGIGVVRLSGQQSLAIGNRLVRLRTAAEPRRAHFGAVLDIQGERLDDGLLTWFPAPASYTGEDVVEISTHGSPVVLQAAVQAAMHHGARLARAGEFTERAYLAGRLDLTAAEAVRDLIDAQTLEQARLAAQQLGGSLSREVAPIKQELLQLIAALEAGIDFAEDDLETMSGKEIARRIAVLLPPLQRLEASFAQSRALREGLKLAIVGEPNVGKSSLFNRLLGRDRAIVTPVAGTTRDVVSEPLILCGIPIQLLDTAGLRDTEDEIEHLGVRRSYEAIAEADLILHVLDATAAHSTGALVASALQRVRHAPVLTIWNKVDALSPQQYIDLCSSQMHVADPVLPSGRGQPANETSLPLFVSAKTGRGIAAMQTRMVQQGTGAQSVAGSPATVTNVRQHRAMEATVQALQHAQTAAHGDLHHELLLLTLHAALEALDTFTGQTTSEDILAQIFSTFCIGK